MTLKLLKTLNVSRFNRRPVRHDCTDVMPTGPGELFSRSDNDHCLVRSNAHRGKPPMASSVALGNLEGTVEKLVASGRFHYTSEVLREGVRLVEEREKRLKLLDAALARGFADAQAGRVEPMDALLDRRAAKYGDLAEKSGR